MTNRKFKQVLVVEHEYKKHEPSLNPVLGGASRKAENLPSCESPWRKLRQGKAFESQPSADGEGRLSPDIGNTGLTSQSERTRSPSVQSDDTDSLHPGSGQAISNPNQTDESTSKRRKWMVSGANQGANRKRETGLSYDCPTNEVIPSPKVLTDTKVEDDGEKPVSAVKQKPRATNTGKAIILVGLDYGMTRSGIWWSLMRSGHIRSSQVFDGWSGSQQNPVKIPTAIAYPSNNPRLKELKTGNDIDAELDACAWFKELLNSNQHPEYLDDPLQHSAIGECLSKLPPDIHPATAARDFIMDMNRQFLRMLKGHFGERFVAQSEIRYMLTHPARWSEQAKYLLRTAAKDAGLLNGSNCDVSLMTEPEAAMLASLKEHQEQCGKDSMPFERHSNVMIVDYGGSTVDTAVFNVKQLKPHLLVKQSCPPDCNCKLWVYNYRPQLPRTLLGKSPFMKNFESERTAFEEGKEERTYRVALRMDGLESSAEEEKTYYDWRHGHVLLDQQAEDMRMLFQSSVERSCQLIEKTINAVDKGKRERNLPKTFILVGGGAGCSYIRHSIETRFQTHPKIGKVKFLYPPKPLIAIAKGAALSADSRHIVMERVCARSYGTTSRQRFDAALDDEEDAVNNATGEKMVDNGCDWLITKGTTYTIKTPCKKSRELSVWVPENTNVGSQRFVWPLITCDGDGEPPKRLKTDSVEVRKIGKIFLDLTKATKSGETIEDDEGCEYEKIVFEMVMEVDYKTGIIGIKAKQGARKIIGKQTVIFDG